MQPKNLQRLLRSLARQGLDVSYKNHTYSVRLLNATDAPVAEVLLPEGFPVEAKALKQFLNQLATESDRIFLGGSMDGDWKLAPEELVPDDGLVRDGGLATIGSGNHFVEVQRVERIENKAIAYAWGIKEGQIAFMIHSGSRNVGKYIGGYWRDRTLAVWEKGVKYPDSHIFPLSVHSHPKLVTTYLQAQATAANYGFVNRLLLAELLRLRLREIYGDVEAPLVYDLPLERMVLKSQQ